MPLFLCKDCGLRIERSMAAYWKNRGHLLCSTCRDRREQSPAIEDSATDLATGCNGNSTTTDRTKG